MKKTIVIVDDHILIANALQSIIANFESFEVLYNCQNGEELQQQMLKENNVPDIILLDISMPIMNGFETAKWLAAKYPNILIMALSMHDDDDSVIKMIRNGAKSYMLKNSNPIELYNALTNLVTNGYYYPDWASSIVFSKLNNNPDEITEVVLSDREIEFLKYVITEMSYKEIGDRMNCSPRTVENYRNSLFEKLNLKTRVGLAVYAMKNQFI